MATEPTEARQAGKASRIPWWWAVLLVLLLGFALFGDKGVLRLVKAYQQKQQLQQQVEQLQQENQQLKAEIEALQHDPQTIERLARQELGMVREDEIVYQFPAEKAPAKQDGKPGAEKP